ncbi:Protein of unknown function [Pyronema omphalodes CBS 100304]|uniref:Uncharacterized protein n=1 Tax=Pyronema omphalodes (strain CBS 100304) TaxID=1076935 RepID=U4KVP3_PYROM|nr:Protein of unknown function [Pyronema omphalodes CBS 100304]
MTHREKQPSNPSQTSSSSTQTPSRTYHRRYSDIEWASPFYPVTPDSLVAEHNVLRHHTASISPHSPTASSSTGSSNLSPEINSARPIASTLPTRHEPTGPLLQSQRFLPTPKSVYSRLPLHAD